MTYSNIVDGAIEYIQHKTKEDRPVTVCVPLNDTALALIEKYRDPDRHLYLAGKYQFFICN